MGEGIAFAQEGPGAEAGAGGVDIEAVEDRVATPAARLAGGAWGPAGGVCW